MITISDNPCGNALGSLIGWNQLTRSLRAGGYSGTNLNQPMRTTPRDVAKLYERLYAGSLASPASNAAFLSLLRAQRVNNRLPQGLPAGTDFAHKTGDLYGFMHDAGIVFGAKTDYLVVMMGAPGAVPSNFASLSAKLYNHFEK
jgi:beta-lactamase class A